MARKIKDGDENCALDKDAVGGEKDATNASRVLSPRQASRKLQRNVEREKRRGKEATSEFFDEENATANSNNASKREIQKTTRSK